MRFLFVHKRWFSQFLRFNPSQVCFICYFVYILKSPGLDSVDTFRDVQSSVNTDEFTNIKDSWFDHKESKTRFPEGMNESGNLLGWKGKRESTRKKRSGFSFKSPSVELWRGLYQRHWPQVLSYYNISLLGR